MVVYVKRFSYFVANAYPLVFGVALQLSYSEEAFVVFRFRALGRNVCGIFCFSSSHEIEV